MAEHDESYKLLFSHPQMVQDLLAGFVPEEWVRSVDFATLEKVSGTFIADDLRDREDDVIWRVRWRDEWLYVYLLIEFQRTVDRFMAVRLMTYRGLLYQDLVRGGRLGSTAKLPPVVPIVLYNGVERWHAPLDVADVLDEHPAGLERYRPRARYLILDEGAFAEADLASLRNLAAAVFRLENSRSPERKTFGRWSRTSSSGSGLRSRRVCAARLRSGSSESCSLPGSRVSIFLK